MRTAVSLAISATLFAGIACAEPAVAPQAGAPTPSGVSAVDDKTVEGVTITGRAFPKTECSSKDAECIHMVVAELKRLYPKPLEQFCVQREWRDIRRGGPVFGAEYQGSAALKIACAADKKPRTGEVSR